MIFIIKVSTNKEEKALEMMSDRIEKKNLNVYSIVKPHGLKGYLIMESLDRESAEDASYNLPYVKGIIGKTVTYEQIKNMLEPKVEDVKIEIGDIVEIIGQTFKGEKAKVTRIDKQKGEVVVSLLGAAVPIPVSVKIDNVKVIRREDFESEDKKEDNEKNKNEEIEEEEEFTL